VEGVFEGIFNVHKPLGITSHQVVASIRRASGQKRVGHAGTLDPSAEGVLLVCAGTATRLSEYLMAGIKLYCAEICLGVSTDTYDGQGRVTRVASTAGVTPEAIQEGLAAFVGRISQKPPAYSALKINGVPLYRLAREGQTVEPAAREVTVYGLRFLAWRRPLVRVLVRCSPGAYIRSIAHDLGERLGCGAHLCHLSRLASGRFCIDEAVDLPVLVDAVKEGYWDRFAHAPDVAVSGMEALVLAKESARRFMNGGDWPAATGHEGQLSRAYDPDGRLVGIAIQREGRWWPNKVLADG
jgi:tRNA pseudouridine55 synthase